MMVGDGGQEMVWRGQVMEGGGRQEEAQRG